MDELLKSYAKKRQDEAGGPAEMHPATRRLLQAEIAKLRPEPSAPRVPWWQNLFIFWPRLAFAAGVFVALGMATWSLMDSTKQAGAESQLAKHEPATTEKAITFAEDRELLRDDKSRAAEPARLAKEADSQSGLAEDRLEAAIGLGREVDTLSKQKAAEVATAEGAATGERHYRSIAPSAPAPSVAPPAANKPATLAEQESLRSAVASASTPQPAPTRPALPGEVRAKDAANVALVTASAEALGKNLAANEETKLGLTPTSAPLNGRDANLSISANNQLSYSVVANADGAEARKLNNNARLPGGVLPPTDAPAQQPLGNAASSLDAFYAANQKKLEAGGQTPNLQLNLNDSSSQTLANNREALLRQNNYDQGASAAAGRTVAPVAQTPPAEGKRDQVALAGAKVASDKAVRELSEAVPARADNYSDADRGVATAQSTQNATLYRQRFAQVPSSGQGTVFKKVSAPATKVLSNFEVQRNGGQVRFVDADGSVYDGQVVADAAAQAGYQAVTTDEARRQLRRSETRQTQTPAPRQAASPDSEGQNWAFRVSGTNRTLHQPVSLEGVMQVGQYQNQAAPSQIANVNGQSPTSAANAPQQLGQSNRRAGQTAGPAAAYKEQLSNVTQLSVTNASLLGAQRIQGRLRVGPATQVELEAVPADN